MYYGEAGRGYIHKPSCFGMATKLKNGETVKVNRDELADFWAAKGDEIEITYSSKPRRPRKKK